MTSEIRANKQTNRVGLGTVEYTNTGIIVSGIVTCTELSGLTALNIAGVGTANTLDINGDIDVDGHTNLDNVSIAGITTISGNLYAEGNSIEIKGTMPYLALTDTNSNPDYSLFNSNGVFSIYDGTNSANRLTISSSGNVGILQDLDVDGHTNLDNVSIAGVATHTGNAIFSGLTASGTIVGVNATFSGNINNSPAGNGSINGFGAVTIQANTPALNFTESDANPDYRIIVADGVFKVQDVTNSYANRLTIGTTGNISISKDLDVDGHTNLDNVNVSGATTCQGGAEFLNSISLNASTNNWVYFNGNLNFARNAHGTEMSIDSNGNVLINGSTFYGTGTGALQVHDSTLVLSKVGTGTRNWRFINNNVASGNLGLQVSQSDNGSTTYGNVIEITKTGRVGINEGSPDSMLHVRNDNSYAAKFGGHGGGSEYYMEIGQLANNGSAGFNATGVSGSMLFKINGSEKLRIDPDGDLGLGDTNPNIRLTVVDSGTDNLVRLGRSDASGHASHTVNVKASKDFYHHFKMEASSFNLDTYNGSAMIEAFKVHNTGYAELAGAADIRLTLGNYGTAGSNGANWVRGTNSSLYYNAGAGIHLWEIGGTEHMRLNGSGNLYLRSESANYVVLGNSGDATSNNVTNSMNWIRGNQTHLQYNSNGGMHAWEISGAEKLRIDTDGTLKLTTPGNTQQQTFFTTFTLNNTNSSTYTRIRFDRSNVSRWGLTLNTDDKFAITNLYKNGSVGANDNTFIIQNDDKIGLNNNSPQAQLHIKHGNSNTDSGLMIQSSVGRYHQTFCGQVTFPSSQGWVNFIYSDHSHSIEIQYMILEDENAGYGGAHGRLSFFTTYGNSSGPVYHENRRNAMNGGGIQADPEFYYQNTGGTVSHMIKVRLQYSGSRTFRMHYMVRGFATGRMYQL